MKYATILLAAALTTFQPEMSMAERVTALPVDEAFKDLSFARYRTELLYMIQTRDVEGVIAKTCPDIKLSFGGDWGHEGLRQNLTNNEYIDTEQYWSDLEKTLRLGGHFYETGDFMAPYTWKFNPTPETSKFFGPFETYFVTGSNVMMRAAPKPDSTALDMLNYDVVVSSDFYETDGDYASVQLWGGKTGYVHKDYLRSLVDYRAQFKKQDDQWLMCIFIAGD